MARKFGTIIDLGTNRITNIGLASSSTDAARYDQLTALSAITPTGGTLAITGAVSATTGFSQIAGTITVSTPLLNATQTWNAVGTTFNGIYQSITNTASAPASRQINLRVNNADSFYVDISGFTYAKGGLEVDNPFTVYSANNVMQAFSDANILKLIVNGTQTTDAFQVRNSGNSASLMSISGLGKVVTPSIQINTTVASVVGQVWTATDTVGNGSWQAGGSGGITVGTATTGTLTKWASSTSITNSLLAESGTRVTLTGSLTSTLGYTYIGSPYSSSGASTVGDYFTLFGTNIKATSSSSAGMDIEVQLTPDTGTNAYGVYLQNSIDATGLTVANYYAHYVAAATKVSGTVTNTYGLYITGQTIGGTTNTGIYVGASASSTQTTSYGMQVLGTTSSAAAASNYGVYITSPTGGGAGGTNYGLYVSWPTGAATKYGAYFAGSVAGNYVAIGDGTITSTGTFSVGALSISTTSSSLTTPVITLNGATGQTGNLATYSVNAVTLSSIDKDGNFIEPMLSSTALFLEDDFVSGNVATTGAIANLNWTSLLGTVALTYQTPVAGHLGIARKTTGTTAIALGTNSCLCLLPSATYLLLPAEMFDMELIFRLNTTTNTEFRFALIATPTLIPATTNTGIGIEKLAADTDFFGFCQDAASKTRTSAMTGGAISTSTWYTLRVRRINSTTIGFNYRAGTGAWGTEQTITANIPTAAMNISIQIGNNNTAAAMTYDIDNFALQVSGITRA